MMDPKTEKRNLRLGENSVEVQGAGTRKQVQGGTPPPESPEVGVAQSCPTPYDPMNCSPPGSSVHGILQERHCSGLPFPSPGSLPNLGIKPGPLELQEDSLPPDPPGSSPEEPF